MGRYFRYIKLFLQYAPIIWELLRKMEPIWEKLVRLHKQIEQDGENLHDNEKKAKAYNERALRLIDLRGRKAADHEINLARELIVKRSKEKK